MGAQLGSAGAIVAGGALVLGLAWLASRAQTGGTATTPATQPHGVDAAALTAFLAAESGPTMSVPACDCQSDSAAFVGNIGMAT
jgi:hypothetical protein